MKKVLLLVFLALSIQAQTIRVTVSSSPHDQLATDAPRKLFHSRMTMPATPRLAFAKWLPGEQAGSSCTTRRRTTSSPRTRSAARWST